MNILITSQHAGVAGSTYSIFYLARGLSIRGHRVYVACPTHTLLAQLLSDGPAHHIPLAYYSKVDRRAIRQVASIVKEYQIEVIDAQASKDRYTTILARWWYKLPVKLVHTRRQMALSMGILGQSWFYQRGTDKIIAVSEGVKTSLVRIGIDARHIKVIYNGTPREKYQLTPPSVTGQLRKKYHIREEDFVIGCVARPKEQVQLLQALEKLKTRVKVIFVGIEYQPAYQQIMDRFPVPHEVYFAGKVDIQAVIGYYPLFSVKVLPSIIEGLSQSLLEAMAMKVPVIATNMGGNAELIEEGKNGYLFENGDISRLTELLEKLIIDRSLRQKLGEYGHRTALETFSMDKTVDYHEELFRQLLGD
jgi:L-malate glycosyltransferase